MRSVHLHSWLWELNVKALKKHPAFPGNISWSLTPRPGFLMPKQHIFLLTLLLLPVSHVHHLCYCSKHLFLSHRKSWHLINLSLENCNLNYTRWLHKQKTSNSLSPQVAFPQPVPAYFSQYEQQEDELTLSGKVRDPRHITPCKMFLRLISRAALKARRVKAGQTATGGSLERGGEPDSPALRVGIMELSFLRKAGFPVLDAEPRLAAW